MSKFLVTLALFGMSVSAAWSQNTYRITQSGVGAYFVSINGAPNLFGGTTARAIQRCIDTIKVEAAGADCIIQFGNGTDVLELNGTGDPLITFDGGTSGADWGTITLTGKANSTESWVDIIHLENGVSINCEAELTADRALICNYSTGTVNITGGTVSSTYDCAVYNHSSGTINISGGTISSTDWVAVSNDFTGTVNISGGTISATDLKAVSNDFTGTVNISGGTISATTGRAVLNNSSGTINISGGTISATTGRAVYINARGKVTISGDAIITSANTDAAQGTIYLYNQEQQDTAVRLEITGGTVKNTANSGNAVYNASAGAVNISGGTISATTGRGVHNNHATGKINISGGTITGTGNGGRAVYNYGAGAINISGGTVKSDTWVAVVNYADGKITISDSALVTSGVSNAAYGTIYQFNNESSSAVRLEITGGTVENTESGGNAIYNASPGAIDISGGTVSATIGFAVWNDFIGKITVSGTAMVTSANSSGNGTIYLANKGTDTTVRLEITGGTVGNTASGGNAIFNASPGAIDISGGTVSVGGGCAVQNVRGTLNISGGTISATSGSAVFNSTAVSKATVNISGGTVSAAGGGSTSTVHTYEGTINISGGTISAINGVAVRCSGSDAEVTISGGTVSSSNSYAILNPYLSGTVTISGGMVLAAAEYAISGGSSTITLSSNAVVFAYGEDDEDVIDGTYTRSGDAVIVAWDEAQGTTTYNAYTSDDIYKLPAVATAVWEHQSGSGGIAYQNGANTGFIPLAAVTVTGTTYLVTVTNGIGGGDYKAGDVVTITANAPPAGQQFKEWTTTPDLTFTSGTSETSPTATFTMPAEAVTATATFEVETGIVGATHALSLRVYPNPTAGKFTILDFRFDDLRVDDLQIEIYDVVGSLLQSKIVNLQSEIAVDISHLAAGLYFLKIDGKMFKVVKE